MISQKITNRYGKKMAVLVEEHREAQGLAFVMHGLSGFKEQPHIAAMAETFKNAGYSVVRFDTTNTLGESEGRLEDATPTSYYEDLEDVIRWAGAQSWYREPFYLAGHSLGGFSILRFAELHPEKVCGLVPVSAVVSGALVRSTFSEDLLKDWEQKGVREQVSESKPGVVKRIKWAHMVDFQKYDLLPDAGKLAMPVLIIVGERDPRTPVVHQQMLYDRLLGKKTFHIIKNAEHNFRSAQELDEIRQTIIEWLSTA